MKSSKQYQIDASPLIETVASLLLVACVFLLGGCGAHHSSSVVHASGPSGVKNVLLVHGAWADGSSWNSPITLLHADGYQVTAVQLPLTSSGADVAVVQRALANETSKTLLVGHSYGGAVITEAGVDPKVAGLVYMSAFAPDENKSALALNMSVPATPIANDLVLNQGFLSLSAAGVAADFAPDLAAAGQVTIAATQGPISLNDALGGAVTNVAQKNVPSWYVVASNDRVKLPQHWKPRWRSE